MNRPLRLALAGAKGTLAGTIRLTIYFLLVTVILVRSPQGRRRRKTI